MSKVLVVGGAGYIGSHACMELAAAGFEPIVYDNLSRGRRKSVQWGPLIVGDILDGAALREALSTYRPEAVMHFAALAYVGESVQCPGLYYLNNTAGTISLLDAMQATGVKRLVFSSTCASYGCPETSPIQENTPQNPINPYGQSKYMAEKIIQDYSRASNLSFIALRYFNACGLAAGGELGVWHEPETRLIPRALMAAAGWIPKLQIFGDDYPTLDGTCIRDYIHVTDLARGHVQALNRLMAGSMALEINLGSGIGLSVHEVLDGIKQHIGREVPHDVQARRPGDPPILVADPALAKKALGFQTENSDIDTIVRTSWVFFRDRSWPLFGAPPQISARAKRAELSRFP